MAWLDSVGHRRKMQERAVGCLQKRAHQGAAVVSGADQAGVEGGVQGAASSRPLWPRKPDQPSASPSGSPKPLSSVRRSAEMRSRAVSGWIPTSASGGEALVETQVAQDRLGPPDVLGRRFQFLADLQLRFPVLRLLLVDQPVDGRCQLQNHRGLFL